MLDFWFSPDTQRHRTAQVTVNTGEDGINIFREKSVHKLLELPQIASIKSA